MAEFTASAGADEQEERTAAQPAHHAARPAPLRLQGADPRHPLSRLASRRVREDVRARQGGAAVPGRADRGRQHRPAVRRRARLPHLARRVRPARRPPGRRRGGRGRPGHPRLGARPAGRGDHRRGPQADGRRRRGRRLGPRPRRAPAERRRAGVRRVLGRHARRARRSSSTTSARATRVRTASSSAISSRGAWSATPAAGTSWGSTPTAARSGSSGSPASSATPGASVPRVVRHP